MTALKLRIPAAGPLTAADHDENMLRLFGFPTLEDMMADEDRDYTFYAAGATVITRAEGYRYQVADAGATDQHLTTAAGLKLYVLSSDDGTYSFGAFNPAGNDDDNDGDDDLAPFNLAVKVAVGNILKMPQRNYFLSDTSEIRASIHIDGNGSRIRWPAGTTGIITGSFYSYKLTGVYNKSLTGAAMIAWQAGLVKYAGKVYHPNTSQNSTYTSAQLGAEQPGTGSRWVEIRDEEGKDATVQVWAGPGTYTTVSFDPAHQSHHTFKPGTYVVCRPSNVSYLVAPVDASDHDHETMFGAKLYELPPEEYISNATSAAPSLANLTLDGTATTGDMADGIRGRTTTKLDNVIVENFSQHGINLQAFAPQYNWSNPASWGNANKSKAAGCTTRRNARFGLLVRGTDCNSSLIYGHDSHGNGRQGIYDDSQLGNNYMGCRTWGNGNGTAAGNTGGRSSVVSHGGNLYQAAYLGGVIYSVPDAQLEAYVEVEPGDDEAVWKFMREGEPSDEFPAWQSGQTPGFYFHGGGVRSNNTARATWAGTGWGDDEGGGVFQGSFILNLGGYQPNMNDGSQLTGENGGTMVVDTLRVANGNNVVSLGKDANFPGLVLAATKSGPGAAAVWRLLFSGGLLNFTFQNHSSGNAFNITDEDTDLNFGTSAPLPYRFIANRGIFIGAGNNARRHDTLTAAPTTGQAARGDVIYNRNPSAGGNVGWICVTAGTPGTWKAFGTIEA